MCIRLLVAISLLLGLAQGCAPRWRSLEAQRVSLGDVSVEPQIRWSALSTTSLEIWTVDGPGLASIQFYKRIGDGQTLIPGGKDAERRPRFRQGMTEGEVIEVIIDSVFPGHPQPQAVRPLSVGAAWGVRFEVAYTSDGGLDRRAVITALVVRNHLTAIVYDAAAIHYFEQHREQIEKVFASIQVQ